MKTYEVIISPKVVEQIKIIKNYISNVKLNPVVAKKTATNIIKEIESLSIFPNRGFNADEKIGVQIDLEVKTYGIIILKGKYIVLYTINEERHTVEVVYLFSTQTEYAKFFLK